MNPTTLTAPSAEQDEANGAVHAPTVVSLLPDHTQLPEEDGSIVQNFQEHPQSILLTDSIWPLLQQRHPDGQFAIGQDSGIYWRLLDPPERGAVAPDWFYVPNVPPTIDGQVRRSYVLWQEFKAPLVVIEFVSETDGGEWDRTPLRGKYWIYENAIHPAYYAIYDRRAASVTVFHLVDLAFRRLPPNEFGRYAIEPLGVELGIWQGVYQNLDLPWLRWWDAAGNLLPTGEERAAREAQRAEQEAQRAEQETQRANQEAQRAAQEAQRADQAEQRAARLAARLQALGIDPNTEV